MEGVLYASASSARGTVKIALTVDCLCVFMVWVSSITRVAAYHQGSVGLPWNRREMIFGVKSVVRIDEDANVPAHSLPSPQISPCFSPRIRHRHRHRHHPEPRYHNAGHDPPNKHYRGDPNVSTNGWNEGQKMGLLLASVAGLLQVVIVIYLLVKRKQMLRVVEKYDV